MISLTRVDALHIMRAGAAAAAEGVLPTTCPYSPNGDDAERLRVAAWMRGYATTRQDMADGTVVVLERKPRGADTRRAAKIAKRQARVTGTVGDATQITEALIAQSGIVAP